MPVKARPYAVSRLPGMTSLRDWFRPNRAGGLGPIEQLEPVADRPVIPVYVTQTPLRPVEYFDKRSDVDCLAGIPGTRRRYLGA